MSASRPETDAIRECNITVSTRDIDGAGTSKDVRLSFFIDGEEFPFGELRLAGPQADGEISEYQVSLNFDLFDADSVSFILVPLDGPETNPPNQWFPESVLFIANPHATPRAFCSFRASDIVGATEDRGFVNRPLVAGIADDKTRPARPHSRR